jgi:hypothetical protein
MKYVPTEMVTQTTTLLDILSGCKKYNVTKLVIETNFGDGMVAELFKKHLQQTKQAIDIEEVRANVRKEDRIIDTLEPVLNQHRLIVDRSVVEWDYNSNKDAPTRGPPPLYALLPDVRMCREKGAVKHDDRLDSLAQGVKYFIDAMGISAYEAVKERKREDWQDLLDTFVDDPLAATNHLVLGFNIDQRRQARGKTKKSVPTWV